MARLCCLRHFAVMVWVPVLSLEGRVTENQYKTVLSDMMKHFYPYGSGLFNNDNAPINWARGITEGFNENYVNNVLWPSQSPVFIPVGKPMGDFGLMC